MVRKTKIRFNKEPGFSDRLRGSSPYPVLVEELIARLQMHAPQATVEISRGLIKIIDNRLPVDERIKFVGDETSD